MKFIKFSAVLLAGLFATPSFAVETTLDLQTYLAGSLRYLESDLDGNEDQFEGQNNGSNVSLTAAIKSENVRLFASYERGLRNDKIGIEQVRQVYGGLETSKGKLLVGKMINDYRSLGQKVDPFYDTGVVGFNGRAFSEGASYGHSNLINGFSRNALIVKTPLLGGRFQFNAGAFFNDKDSPNNDTDYAGGGVFTTQIGEDKQFTAGVQYLKIKNPAAFAPNNRSNNERYAVAGSPGLSSNTQVVLALTTPKYSLGTSVENVDVEAEGRARRYYAVSGTYALTDATRAAASIGYLDFGTGNPDIGGRGYSLGLFTKLGESLNGYVAVRDVDLDNKSLGDALALAVGLSFSFSNRLYPFSFGAASAE